MLSVHCPHCGPRPETEFRHGGHAGITRPQALGTVDDDAFAAYLFVRVLPADGRLHERWCHAAGCGQWFTATRRLTDAAA